MANRNLAINLLIKAKDLASNAVGKFRDGVDSAASKTEQFGSEADGASGNTEKLSKSTDSAGGSVRAFRENLSKGITTLVKWTAAAGTATAALAVGVVTRFTTSQADLARQTLASSRAFGISATELQKWQYASNEVGISGEKTADIMKDVAEKIGDAFLNGSGEASEVIQGLGLDLEKLARMRPDEQILAISTRLNGMPKPGQIQILEALASDASLLLPLLDNNAQKLRELAAEAENRGAIFSEAELQQLAEVDSAFRKISTRVSGFIKQVAIELAPAFTKIAGSIDTLLKGKPKLVDDIADAFTKLIEITSRWLEKISSDSDGVINSVSKIGNAVEGVRQLFMAAFYGVQSFAAGSIEVAARVVYSWNSATASITKLLNKVGLASDQAVELANRAVENAASSVADLIKQGDEYKTKMVTAGEAAATAFSKARDGAAEVASAATNAGKAAAEFNEKSSAEGEKAKDQSEQQAEAITGIANSYRKARDKAKELGDASEETGGKILLVGEAGEQAGNQTRQAMERAATAAASIGSFYDGITSKLSSMSLQTVNYFKKLQGAAQLPGEDLEFLSEHIDELSDRISGLKNAASTDFTGITTWMRDTARYAAQAEREFFKQKLAVEQLVEAYERGDYSSSLFSRSVEGLERQFDLLDDQDLGGLRSAIERVQGEVDSLKDSLTDTVSSLRQELAGLQGDNAEVERLRFQEQRLELETQLQRAQKLGDQQAVSAAQEALALQRQAYSLRQQQIKQQAEEDRQRAAEAKAEEERRRQEQERQQREQEQQDYNRETRQATAASPTRTIVLQSPSGQSATLAVNDDQDEARLISVLEDAAYRSF